MEPLTLTTADAADIADALMDAGAVVEAIVVPGTEIPESVKPHLGYRVYRPEELGADRRDTPATLVLLLP